MAATILRNICLHSDSHEDFVNSQGVECLVSLINGQSEKLQTLAVEALAKIVPYCTYVSCLNLPSNALA